MPVFYSRFSNLKLTVEPPTEEIIQGKRRLIPGKIIRFRNGTYSTSNKREIEFIRNHRWYGSFISETPVSLREVREGPNIIEIACDFPGCTYIAKGRTADEAFKMLRGHQVSKGHIPGLKIKDVDDEELDEDKAGEDFDGYEEEEDEE